MKNLFGITSYIVKRTSAYMNSSNFELFSVQLTTFGKKEAIFYRLGIKIKSLEDLSDLLCNMYNSDIIEEFRDE